MKIHFQNSYLCDLNSFCFDLKTYNYKKNYLKCDSGHTEDYCFDILIKKYIFSYFRTTVCSVPSFIIATYSSSPQNVILRAIDHKYEL